MKYKKGWRKQKAVRIAGKEQQAASEDRQRYSYLLSSVPGAPSPREKGRKGEEE